MNDAQEHDSHDSPPPADTPEPALAVATEGVEKPKRRRAPRKPKVEGDEASASAPANAAPAAADAPARDDAGADQAAAVGDEAAEGSAPRADGERGPRRGRNRRRGRRGGERRGEGATTDGATTEETEGVERAEGVAEDAAAAALPREPAPDVNEVFAEVLSGAFDVEPPAPEEGAEPAPRPKRVLPPEPDSPKLHKVLAQAGVGSRRDLEQMIVEGRLTVNGQPAHTGQRISFGDRIALDGKPVRYRIAPPPPRVLAYHKPAGEVVTHDDPQQRPTVFRRLPRLPHGKWQSVGRLDINTEGLLLFSSSGELANQLMHPRFGVEREYAVRSLGVLDEEARARLLEGVEIDGQRAAFKSIEDGGGEGANHWYRVVITEGRNREVRRLFEAVGHAVSRLIRIRYGSVVLPRGLRRGVWVELHADDVRALRRLAHPGPQAQQGGQGAHGPAVGIDGEREGRGRRNRRRRGADRARGPRPDMGNVALPPGAHADFDDEHHDHIDGAAIPNPLQQTYDKRAIQQARKAQREIPEDGPIPNPLQQTYDKRALQRDRQPQREYSDDGPIPNPLQQTYDKRFAQGGGAGLGGGRRKGGKGGKGGKPAFGGPNGPNGPGGQGGQRAGKGKGKPGARAGGPGAGGGQPDPMRTSVGYIGADAFLRKGGRGGGRRGPGGGGRPR